MTTGGIVGSLSVNIVAKIDKFISGLNSASTWMGRFVAKTNSVGKSIKGLWESGQYIWGVIAAGVERLISASIEAGSHIAELTKKLHVSSEAITALHFAAEQLNSSADAVDTGMAKLAINLGKALNGSKESAAAFGLLGINFQTLSKLNPAQRFLAVIDALHNIPDEAQRAAIAQEILGKQAGELAPLIEAGSSAIVAQAGAAAKAGNLMTEGVTKNLDESGSALKRLGASWRSFRDEFVSGIAPAIEFLSWFGTKAIQNIKVFFGVFRAGFAEFYQVATYAILGVVKLMNLILPKKWQIGTEALSNFAKGAGEQRNEEWKYAGDNAAAFFGVGNAQKNPLQTPTNQADKNTTIISDKMDELIAVMRAKNNPVPATPAQSTGMPVLVSAAGVR